jgi:signal transduction histidine kinase
VTVGIGADLVAHHTGRTSGPGTAAPEPPPPPPTAPTADELLARVQHPRLREGAEHLLALWTNERGDALDLDDARAALAWLALAVDEAIRGHAPSRDNPANTVLGRHFLQLLRAEMVAAWTAEPVSDARAMLTALQAFEAVRVAIEPDWSQYFTSRLSGPDGLDLVVEVAHDLRSPVTSIIFLAETLSRGQSGDVTELQKRQLRLIYSAALGLSSMASDVIELARGGDQLVERELSPFSVAEILESVTDMVRPIAEEKGLALRFTPPPSDYRTGRPLALSRVLLNLTTNALKFTDDGFVEILTRAKGQAKMEFSVRDTGHGVSADALANLYQPFRRTRARAGRSGYYFSGTGLGLAMCRKLVEAMGSELKLETKAGWGTRFYFDLDLPPAGQM